MAWMDKEAIKELLPVLKWSFGVAAVRILAQGVKQAEM
jgi:hypothetical protein